MKFGLLALALFCCGAARAQDTRSYLFFAPGGKSSNEGTVRAYSGGAGVAVMLAPHFGVGAELGTIAPTQGKVSDTILGEFSANAYGHFLRHSAFDPYVTGGYSLLFRDFTANGVNFGAGFNYWFHERVGLLLEGRDTRAQFQSVSTHLWGIRIGLTFR